MEIRKGFYFSFDAILALTIMSATLVMMLSMMDTNYGNLNQQSQAANSIRTESRDAMSLAAAETFQTYNESFRDELVANSVMDADDLDKSILNGITYLWAAGNFSYAEEATERYFDPQIDGSYQIQINEGGNTYTLPQDVERPESTDFVTTASSLVSGHRLNSSNTGFRARARVTSAEAERTDIIPISPSGNLPTSPGFTAASFETTQYIPVEDSNSKVLQQATLDLNFREADIGPSDFTVTVNGQEVSGTQLASRSSGGDGGSQYYRYDVTDEIEIGQNNTVTYSTDSIFFTGGFLNPGSRLRVDYTEEPSLTQEESVTKRIPLKYVQSQYGSLFGGGDGSGVYNVENFEIPETADIHSANLTLNAEGVGTDTSPTGWDVRTVINDNTVIEENGNGDYSRTLNITEEIQNGNNLLRVYINHDGEDQFWGGTETVLNSDPGTADHSYIEISYTDRDRIGYGKYEATVAEEIGQNGDGSVTYSKEFTQYDTFSQINLYMAAFAPDQPTVEARAGTNPYQTVYSSNEIAPSLVSINPDIFNFDQTNYVRMSDTSTDTRFLEYSLFEYSAFVEPRVGYGPVFDNITAAQQDAVQRLENKSGNFFDFENIEPSSVTIGGERRLWGPSTVTLVRWEE